MRQHIFKVTLTLITLGILRSIVYANNTPVVIAGNGLPGFAGDGGPATEAQFFQSSFITGDNAGNIYIADTGNHRIRKIDSNGIITTVAGNGTWGKGGDGGLATEAQLNNARGLAVDAAGNLYIVGSSSHRIRKVDSSGIISTAVNGESYLNSMSGMALDDAGNIYIADTGNSRVRKIEPNGNVTTIAENVSSPNGLVLDAEGNIYIADTSNFRVHKIDTNGIITIFAGNGTTVGSSATSSLATLTALNGPSDLAFDSAGNLYISDANGIHKVDPSGIISTVVRDPVTSPYGLFIDASDNLFIVDAFNNVVWRVANISQITSAEPLPQSGTQIRLTSQTLTFGTVLPGQSPNLNLTVTNDSEATNDLTIRQISLVKSVPRFTISLPDSLPILLQPGNSLNLTVTFSSTFLGPFSDQIRILSNDPTLPILYVPMTAQVQTDTTGQVQTGTTGQQPGTGSESTVTTVSPSGHFMIHYTREGSHAVDTTDTDQNNIPDYVDEVARTYDHVRATIVDSLEFRPPPSDGNEFFDVKILNLGAQGSYGFTYPGIFPVLTTHSRIEIDNDFTDAIYYTSGLNGISV